MNDISLADVHRMRIEHPQPVLVDFADLEPLYEAANLYFQMCEMRKHRRELWQAPGGGIIVSREQLPEGGPVTLRWALDNLRETVIAHQTINATLGRSK